MIRNGKIDPDVCLRTFKHVAAVVATSKASPAALPWQDAPAVCRHTVKLIAGATCGWHRTTHWLHHAKVRSAIISVLLVAWRLETDQALPALAAVPAAAAATNHGSGYGIDDCMAANHGTLLPALPIEMWHYSMRFVQRSWWPSEQIQSL